MALSAVAQETIVNAMSYLNIFFSIMLVREVFFHIIPHIKGDHTVSLGARQKQERKRAKAELKHLNEIKEGEAHEKKETGLEIKDEQALIKLFREVINDLETRYGPDMIMATTSHLSEIQSKLNLLTKLETMKIKEFRHHLKDMPHHKEVWKDLQDEEGLTIILEKLITRAIQNLTSDPKAAIASLKSGVIVLERLIQTETREMKLES